MIKYAVAMGIRMVCLVLVFVVEDWFKILPVLGAVFLPWIAVVIANGNDQAEIHSDSLLEDVALVELEAPAAAAGPAGSAPFGAGTDAGDDAPVMLLQGELIEDDDDKDQGRAAS